jgi:hypothetical protein
MTAALAAISHHRRPSPHNKKVRSAMRHFLQRCAVGAFALVLVELPVPGLAAPAISRADDDCAPGGPGRPGARGPGWTRPALDV